MSLRKPHHSSVTRSGVRGEFATVGRRLEALQPALMAFYLGQLSGRETWLVRARLRRIWECLGRCLLPLSGSRGYQPFLELLLTFNLSCLPQPRTHAAGPTLSLPPRSSEMT